VKDYRLPMAALLPSPPRRVRLSRPWTAHKILASAPSGVKSWRNAKFFNSLPVIDAAAFSQCDSSAVESTASLI
jgi:hypothetical protein